MKRLKNSSVSVPPRPLQYSLGRGLTSQSDEARIRSTTPERSTSVPPLKGRDLQTLSLLYRAPPRAPYMYPVMSVSPSHIVSVFTTPPGPTQETLTDDTPIW